MAQVMFSGPQIIYRAIHGGAAIPITEGVCRICGGALLAPVQPARQRSESWTDENLCLRRDSPFLCQACAWFAAGNNRINFWQKKPALYMAEGENHPVSLLGLLQILKGDFKTPAVFLVKGRDPQLARKHQQWKTIRAVTDSRRKTKIPFIGIQRFREDKISGVAEFEADQFTAAVEMMRDLSQNYLLPAAERLQSDWAKQNHVFSLLLNALGAAMSPANYLAAYLASHAAVSGGGDPL